MKSFKFKGTSIFSFSYLSSDYILSGEGPFLLPENSPMVQTLKKKKLLVAIPSKKVRTKKN